MSWLEDMFGKKKEDSKTESPKPIEPLAEESSPMVEAAVAEVIANSEEPKTIMPKNVIYAWCVKCRQQTIMNVESSRIINVGRGDKGHLSGFCNVCNHKVSKFVSAKDVS